MFLNFLCRYLEQNFVDKLATYARRQHKVKFKLSQSTDLAQGQ